MYPSACGLKHNILATSQRKNEPLKAQNVINKTGKLHEQCHNKGKCIIADISSESPAPLSRQSSVFGCIWHLIMASLGLIGRIDPFDETIESWWNYVERLKQYFEANKVDNTKKVSSLLTLIGGKHTLYSFFRDLTFPDKPSTKTYDQLTQLLNKQLSPKPLIIAERYRFY